MITIVIPVRNATATLGACLDALARQTLGVDPNLLSKGGLKPGSAKAK